MKNEILIGNLTKQKIEMMNDLLDLNIKKLAQSRENINKYIKNEELI